MIPERGGVWAAEISAGVTDDASSGVMGTMSSSETGSDSADTTSVSGTAELWAGSEVSSAAWQHADEDWNKDLKWSGWEFRVITPIEKEGDVIV